MTGLGDHGAAKKSIQEVIRYLKDNYTTSGDELAIELLEWLAKQDAKISDATFAFETVNELLRVMYQSSLKISELVTRFDGHLSGRFDELEEMANLKENGHD